MFSPVNPVEYRKNRKEGNRGQGTYVIGVDPAFKEEEEKSFAGGKHIGQIGKKIVQVNRKTARKVYKNHQATSKTAQTKTPETALAIVERVKRTEQGEKQRVAVKKAELAADALKKASSGTSE